jgi:cytochrome c-type biogenesis protein
VIDQAALLAVVDAGARQTVLDGSLLLAVPLAMAAGLVSFVSPCVLPLVPGYLGYVTGLTGVDLEQQRRGRMLTGAALFVLGFTAVYVVMGATVGALAALLITHKTAISRVLGVVTIGLGVVYLGAFPALQRDRRVDVRPAAGLAGAPLLGAVFALGWTACTGPTLGAIFALTGIGGNPGRGALLATAYCFGLGVPFLLAALAYRRMMGAFAVVRRHRALVTRSGGVMLVVIGVMITSGAWQAMTSSFSGWIAGFEVPI